MTPPPHTFPAALGTLRRTLARRLDWRRLPGALRRRVEVLVPELEASATDLVRFGGKSGREFTALASALGRLGGQLGRLRGETEGLAAVLKGEDEDRALDSALDVFRRSVDLVHASMGLSLSEEVQIQAIEARLLAHRASFARQTHLFRVLVIAIRTEAARIDADHRGAFTQIADEIAGMVSRMAAVSEGAFTRIEDLIREETESGATIQALRGSLAERSTASVAAMRAELAAIHAALGPCDEAARGIIGLLDQSREVTGGVMTALQYQDIVRQQLEHVVRGLGDLVSHIRAGEGHGTGGRTGRLEPGYIHHAARIQEAQLAGARASIEQAGAAVTGGLGDLLAMGRDTLARFASLEERAHAVLQRSRLSGMFGEHTTNLIRISTESEKANRRIHAFVDEVDRLVTGFSRETAGQEFEVKLVALNAQVAAAHLASAPALNRLAEETSRLADETARMTRAMSLDLARTMEQLTGLRSRFVEIHGTLARDRAELEERTALTGAKLDSLGSRVTDASGRIAAEFRVSQDELESLLRFLRFPEMIATSYTPAQAICGRLLRLVDHLPGTDPLSDGARERIEAHRGHYTMLGEHEIHASLVGSGPRVQAQSAMGGPGAAPSGAAPEGGDIELFSMPGPPGEGDPAQATAPQAQAPACQAPAPAPGGSAPGGIELF